MRVSNGYVRAGTNPPAAGGGSASCRLPCQRLPLPAGFYFNSTTWLLIAGPYNPGAAAPAPAPGPAPAAAPARRLLQQGPTQEGVDLSLSPPDMPVRGVARRSCRVGACACACRQAGSCCLQDRCTQTLQRRSSTDRCCPAGPLVPFCSPASWMASWWPMKPCGPCCPPARRCASLPCRLPPLHVCLLPPLQGRVCRRHVCPPPPACAFPALPYRAIAGAPVRSRHQPVEGAGQLLGRPGGWAATVACTCACFVPLLWHRALQDTPL